MILTHPPALSPCPAPELPTAAPQRVAGRFGAPVEHRTTCAVALSSMARASLTLVSATLVSATLAPGVARAEQRAPIVTAQVIGSGLDPQGMNGGINGGAHLLPPQGMRRPLPPMVLAQPLTATSDAPPQAPMAPALMQLMAQPAGNAAAGHPGGPRPGETFITGFLPDGGAEGGADPQDMPPGLQAAELRDGWREADGTRMAAIRVALASGWKTYWRSPGDAGIPPEISFAGSRNVADVRIHWPTPEVFDQNGMRSVGYHGTMLLPLEIIPVDPAQPVHLDAQMDFGICHDICVPVTVAMTRELAGDLTSDLPAAGDRAARMRHTDEHGTDRAQIRAALARQPGRIDGLARCAVSPVSDGMQVRARIALPEAPGQLAIMELTDRPAWVSEAVMDRDGPVLLAQSDIVPDAAKPFDLDLNALRITVLDDAGQAIETMGCQPDKP